MLNINNFLPVRRQQSQKTTPNTQQPLKQNSLFSINAEKLAPLKKDTVSFTAVAAYKNAIENVSVCKSLYANAKPAQEYLQNTLNDCFAQKDKNGDIRRNEKGEILYLPGVKTVKGRRKSADSIQEKVANKIENALNSKNDFDMKKSIFNPNSEDAIKSKVKDLIGARIVMRDTSFEKTAEVLNRLAKTIEEKGIIIEEIENHPPKNGEVKPYFRDKDLEILKKSVNKVREKNGLKPIKIDPKPIDSGYMALHLGVDLTNVGELKTQNGYHGEIQILGADVEMLKDVEDLCYKLKSGKAIKSDDLAFEPFARIFNEAFNTGSYKKDKMRKNAFNEYTKKAFESQRDRRPTNKMRDNVADWGYVYPTLKDCGFEKELPSVLDFNVLARIYRDCDDLYKVEHKTDEVLREMTENK